MSLVPKIPLRRPLPPDHPDHPDRDWSALGLLGAMILVNWGTLVWVVARTVL